MTIFEPTTARLRLRQWRAADRAPFAALCADPEVMRYFPAPLDRAAADHFVDTQGELLRVRGWGLWAVEHAETGRFLGMAGLAVPAFVAPITPCVEVGWRFARDAWGHGYATEAGRAALSVAFDVVGLPDVVAFTATPNRPSMAVMERIGMQRSEADDFDHPALPPGHRLRRHVVYRVTRGGWPGRTAA